MSAGIYLVSILLLLTAGCRAANSQTTSAAQEERQLNAVRGSYVGIIRKLEQERHEDLGTHQRAQIGRQYLLLLGRTGNANGECARSMMSITHSPNKCETFLHVSGDRPQPYEKRCLASISEGFAGKFRYHNSLYHPPQMLGSTSRTR